MRLSKSKFTTGLQCHKLLWWKVHERDAPELVPDARLQAVFDTGNEVGERAQAHYPGGTLVPLDFQKGGIEEALTRTRELLEAGVTTIYEASFFEHEVFVAVDVLRQERGEWVLGEVKSTNSAKKHHEPDVAIQTWVARAAGIDVRRAELIHLNRKHRHPDDGPLFVADDLTPQVEAFIPTIEDEVAAQLTMLAGGLPDVDVGRQCSKPYDCPFYDRCWPEQAVPTGEAVVGPGLGEALAEVVGPLAYLDFETVNVALPVWKGCGTYQQVPVQFSVHRRPAAGSTEGLEHEAYLAEGPGDPREALAHALVEATRGYPTVFAYYASFEATCIRGLAEAVPGLADELNALADRLADLHPIVKEHVEHPAFEGSFSLKMVAPALLSKGYEGMAVADGQTAAVLLRKYLLAPDSLERDLGELRRELLAYCERDTEVLVELHDVLLELSREEK